MQPFFFKKQLFALILFLTVFIFQVTIKPSNAIISISFILIILSMTFLPYFKSKIGYPRWIQVMLFSFPLYFPIILTNYQNLQIFKFDLRIFFIGAAATCFLTFIVNWKIIYAQFTSPITNIKLEKKKAFFLLLEILVIVLGEELYYRYFLLTHGQMFLDATTSILLSSFLFSYSHFLNRWATITFTRRSYISLFALGITLSYAYLKTESISICILLHLIYNSVQISTIIKRLFARDFSKSLSFDDYDD